MKLFFYKLIFRILDLFNILILNRLKLKIVPKNRPNRDFSSFIAHLKNLKFAPKSVIDVGVAFGTPDLYTSLPDSDFYLVEPNPNAIPYLKSIQRKLANCKIFNVAAGASEGTIPFYVHDDVSGSSPLRQTEGSFLDGQEISVPVQPLESLVSISSEARPSLLKIDTQGYELEVLAGAVNLLSSIDILIIECSFHAFRHSGAEIDDIFAFMKRQGFKPYDLLEGHYRSLDSALAQVDVVFIRDDSPLRSNPSFFTTEQALDYLR